MLFPCLLVLAVVGGGGVVAVRASERRSIAVRTERGVVVAVRSDEWCVRFDVRVAVRRRIELAFRRERADADSVRNDDVGARRCEPVRVWWHRGGVAIWIFERAERADEAAQGHLTRGLGHRLAAEWVWERAAFGDG